MCKNIGVKERKMKGRKRERKKGMMFIATIFSLFFALNHSKCRVKEMCQLPSAPVEEEKGKQGLGLKFKG